MTAARGKTSPVRLRDGEWEFRCSRCLEWWALTTEFWASALGMARCRACILEAKRVAYHRDPEKKREASRLYRASQPGVVHTIKWERVVQRRREDPAYDAAFRARRCEATRQWRARRGERAA